MLADTADFDLLTGPLGEDVRSSLMVALGSGAIFPIGTTDPLSLFRLALSESIRDIENHPRGVLLQAFLRDGPYEGDGAIPPDLAGKRLSDDDVARAIAFIAGQMVLSFQGRLAEILSIRPCVDLLQRLKRLGAVPPETTLHVGDAFLAGLEERRGAAKGADLHLASVGGGSDIIETITVHGVVEVKSYHRSLARFRTQVGQHVSRLAHGACLLGVPVPGDRVLLGENIIRIAVEPARWTLPRTFSFEDGNDGRILHVYPPVPPVEPVPETCERDGIWRITLRWSHEALAAAAYDVTFWYMAAVGEVLFGRGVSSPWPTMGPADAGRNAVKQMLYFAILRARSAAEAQRAIALYNIYGFGYALGANFQDRKGHRKMLWFEDLEEIVRTGLTKHGCRIAQASKRGPRA